MDRPSSEKDELDLSADDGKGSQSSSASVSSRDSEKGIFSKAKAGITAVGSRIASLTKLKKTSPARRDSSKDDISVGPVGQEQPRRPKTMREEADQIVNKWSHADTTEDSVLLRVLSDPMADEEVDLRTMQGREGQRIEKESKSMREELDTVTGVLEEMEKADNEAYIREEEQKKQWSAEYESNAQEVLAKVKEHEVKLETLVRQLDEYRKEAQRLAKELEQVESKARDVEIVFKQTQLYVESLRQQAALMEKSHVDKMTLLEKKLSERRSSGTRNLNRYKKAKAALEDALEERRAVKRVLSTEDSLNENLPMTKSAEEKYASQVVPLQTTDEHKIGDVQPKATLMSPEDEWKERMVATVKKIHSLSGPKELLDEGALSELRGYICAKNPMKQTRTCKVYPARLEDTRICVKEIDFKTSGKPVKDHLWNYGFKILRFISLNPFPNLAEIYATFVIRDEKAVIFEQRLKLDLRTYIKKEGPQTEKNTRRFALSLAKAIDYLHGIGVAHQNICPANVYIDESQDIRLGSLEYSITFWNVQRDRIRMQTTFKQRKQEKCLAPEVADRREYDPTMADVFSYGVIVAYMLLGRYFYESRSKVSEEEQKKFARVTIEQKMSELGRDLLYRCIQMVPEDRIRSRQIIVHPWFNASNSSSTIISCTKT